MTIVECDPGICGMPCTIEANKSEGTEKAKLGKGKVKIEIKCDCDRIVKMASQLKEVDEAEVNEWDPIKPRGESKICQYSREFNLCAACPVPTAILKAVEAEAGLAIPKDAHITFTKTERRY
ncbi:MAG: hypothetical protein R6T78_04420 [Dehalococcoidales bacterium]